MMMFFFCGQKMSLRFSSKKEEKEKSHHFI